MGRRTRQRRPEGRHIPVPVADLAGEWKGLTPGELVFVALVGVGIVVVALTVPGGTLDSLISAISVGLVAGLAIALNRRRRGHHE
jgi:hypothetical protein